MAILIGDDTSQTILGTIDDDFIDGQGGNDLLKGSDGKDYILGGTGEDDLRGNEGNDNLNGQDGNDLLYGHEGKDRLFGGKGDDTLNGGSGNDRIFGARGDDIIVGGTGDDKLGGGLGADEFWFSSNDGDNDDVIFHFEDDIDTIRFKNGLEITGAFQDGDNAVIETSTGGTITIKDTTLLELADDIEGSDLTPFLFFDVA